MKHTVFRTPTEFDLRSLDTTGMSAKPNSDNPIGRFGSGLKYAIAILLREGANIRLHCNGYTYTFYTKPEVFRGITFQRCMYRRENGLLRILTASELPFTTDLGGHWELWQAFRELYANTLDEEGVCYLVGSDDVEIKNPKKDHTYIVVEHVEFAKIFDRRGTIFLDPTRETVVEVEGEGNISPKQSQHLYFRGMRAFDLPEDKPALFTYNIISEQELTEDRTLKSQYAVQGAIRDMIVQSTDKAFIKTVLTAPEKTFEKDLDFEYVYNTSKEFKEAVTESRNHPSFSRSAGAYYSRAISPPKAKVVEDHVWAKILEVLSEAGKRIHEPILNDPIPSLSETIQKIYLEAFERKFER